MLDEINAVPVASIQGLRVEFQTKDGPVLGVESVSFQINSGEQFALLANRLREVCIFAILMRLVEFSGGKITQGKLILTEK